MGIGPFKSLDDDYGISYASIAKSTVKLLPLPNPDPENYELLDVIEVGKSVVVKVKYADCTNYEGTKILVYRNTTANEVCTASQLDPHFKELPSPYLVPFARFEPTPAGMKAALFIAEAYSKG